MNFTLTVKMDNAAFEDEREIGEVLTHVAERVSQRSLEVGDTGTAMDTNGNTVARWEVTT